MYTCVYCSTPFKRSRPDANNEKHCSLQCRWDSKVDKTDGCWLRKGALFKTGYGAFMLNGKAVYAHRFALELHGVAPGKLFVMHSCDNPRCVNPAHLSVGTSADNTKDMMSKGRHAYQKWSDPERKAWLRKLQAGLTQYRSQRSCV